MMRTVAIITATIHAGQAFHTEKVSRAPIPPAPAPATIPQIGISSRSTRSSLFASTDNDNDAISSATATVSKAESILDKFHRSNLTFRIIVIGNGAILETTSKLGPTSKSSISPKSGEKLVTFASEDQSFEFHVKVDQVCKVAFVSAKRRVARFLKDDGSPIASLILVDSSSEADGWFDGMVGEYGDEVIM